MSYSILYTVCFSEVYGTQKAIISLASSLDYSKYTPIISAPESEELRSILQSRNIAFEPLPFSNIHDLKTITGLRNIIRNHNVSLIHANLGISTFLSLSASIFPPRVPVICTRHITNDRYTEIGNKLLYIGYKNMYHAMNLSLKRIIFPSLSTKISVEKREGGVGNRGLVIPNGINVPNFKMPPVRRYEFRKAYDIAESDFLVACISRLSDEKRVDTLINAAAIIVRSNPNVRFIVAGEGPSRNILNNMLAKNKLEKSFIMPGYLAEVSSLLCASDIYVHCCPIESFGLSVLEAMAAGTPVVCARGGGPLEIIDEGLNGLFFEPGNADELAEKIIELKNNVLSREILKTNASIKVEEFDESVIATMHQSVYDEVLGSKQ